MSEALRVDPDKVRRLSLSEQELVKAAAAHREDLIRYPFLIVPSSSITVYI